MLYPETSDMLLIDYVAYVLQVGTTFAGPQPVVYNPQAAQMPSQPYFHPNGPQVGFHL